MSSFVKWCLLASAGCKPPAQGNKAGRGLFLLLRTLDLPFLILLVKEVVTEAIMTEAAIGPCFLRAAPGALQTPDLPGDPLHRTPFIIISPAYR